MSTPSDVSDSIFVESIEFYGYHGASDDEQTVGHRYAVDVQVDFDTSRAAASDDLADTVNYSHLARRLVEIGTSQRYRLLEALADRMASAVLREFPIEAVVIKLRKVHPPMNVIAAGAGVVVRRARA